MINNKRNRSQIFAIVISVFLSSIFVAQNAVALDDHKADTKIHPDYDVTLLAQNTTPSSNFITDFLLNFITLQWITLFTIVHVFYN